MVMVRVPPLRDQALSDVAAITVALEVIRRATPAGTLGSPVERAWDQLHRSLGALERRLELMSEQPSAEPEELAPGQ
jgi:hypothetical protein